MYRIRRGIGRVEALVVVFIVAMLLGVLLPAMAKGRSESASEVCESKLRRGNGWDI